MGAERQPKKIATLDFETDPFKFNREPKPFAAGLFTGNEYTERWGDDCASQIVADIHALKDRHLIYAHNGGKFDFYFLLPWLENPIRIINGRIVSAKIGRHELRDSFAILPIPLAAYKKDEIDYEKFERGIREKYRADILHYLAKDCEYLHFLVTSFVDRFGAKLTIGATALSKLRELHKFPSQNEAHDEKFRQFYFGGRCEFFKRGILRGNWKIYDVNSMYPDAMRNYDHPCGKFYSHVVNPKIAKSGLLRNFKSKIYFAQIVADSDGALPLRTKNGLTFPTGRNEFFACSHEIIAGIETGRLTNIDCISAFVPHRSIRFAEYVDTYIAEKIDAKKSGDKPREIFAKLLLNSAYGKTATNPRAFKDYEITGAGIRPTDPDFGTVPYGITDDVWIWAKPTDMAHAKFIDVAIGASITSASRATLLRALSKAINPIYCDTDSIICEELPGIVLDDSALGAWKYEGGGNVAAIAGKKLYAIFDGNECVKMASKGVRLAPEEIKRICRGEKIEWANDAPSFSLSGSVKFVERTIGQKFPA